MYEADGSSKEDGVRNEIGQGLESASRMIDLPFLDPMRTLRLSEEVRRRPEERAAGMLESGAGGGLSRAERSRGGGQKLKHALRDPFQHKKRPSRVR